MTPKRTYRQNVYGNVVGYEGGKRVEEFGCSSYSQRWAKAWANGASREDAECIALGVINADGGK